MLYDKKRYLLVQTPKYETQDNQTLMKNKTPPHPTHDILLISYRTAVNLAPNWNQSPSQKA